MKANDLWKFVGKISHKIVYNLVSSKVNTANGIYLSMDCPYTRTQKLNITRPAVLRQYFGAVDKDNDLYNNYVPRYTYGGGLGSASKSVGTIQELFYTRGFSRELQSLATLVHSIVFSHCECTVQINRMKHKNEEIVRDAFNHCTVLMYYGIEEVKRASKLGLHCDCVFGKDGSFKDIQNSQKENTVTVSITIGDSRVLKHFERIARMKGNGKFDKWEVIENEWIETILTEGTLMVIHPHDEKPFIINRNGVEVTSQLQHGKVNVEMGKWSGAIVFRTVSKSEYYSRHTNKIIDRCHARLINDVPDENTRFFSKEEMKIHNKHHDRILELYKDRVLPLYKSL